MSTFEKFIRSDEVIIFFWICWLVVAFVVAMYRDRERREKFKEEKNEKFKEEKNEKFKEEKCEIQKIDQNFASSEIIEYKTSNKNASLSQNNTYYNFTNDFNKSSIRFYD